MFTFLSKSILVLALRGLNDKMRETHEAYQVPLLVGFHWLLICNKNLLPRKIWNYVMLCIKPPNSLDTL